MRTVGQILKEEREKKFYTLEEIEKVTKIRVELLKALEADEYSKLPPSTFVQGFIKNYGKFLKLDTEKLLAIFRREFSDRKNPPRIMDALIHPIGNNRFSFTPTRLLSGLVVGLILAFFIYLWFEYRFLVGATYLEVSAPLDQANTDNPIVKVIGKTETEARVEINNQVVAVDQAGNFSQELTLSDSSNIITVTATSRFGKKAEIDRTVFLKQ